MFPFLIKTDSLSWQNENVLHLVKSLQCHNSEAEWRVGFNQMKWNVPVSPWLRVGAIGLSITSAPASLTRSPAAISFHLVMLWSSRPETRDFPHAILGALIRQSAPCWCGHKVFVIIQAWNTWLSPCYTRSAHQTVCPMLGLWCGHKAFVFVSLEVSIYLFCGHRVSCIPG